MGRLNLPYKRVPADEKKYGKGFTLNTLPQKEFESFNESILGLGDISRRGEYTQALAAFLDLEGFTDFSNQVDSHLVIPEFMKAYLTWVFSCISKLFKEGESEDRVRIWGSLPFYAKFLGDGLLFLWNTEFSGGDSGVRNIVQRLFTLTKSYKTDLLPVLKKKVSKPPSRVRCGIARGQIMTVGDGNDFVGSCLNIASRLQKLSLLSFAISRRGLDLTDHPSMAKVLVLKQVELRGIGKEELVYVLDSELEALPAKEKKLFKEP
jgi:class 3 adenylate cyclase